MKGRAKQIDLSLNDLPSVSNLRVTFSKISILFHFLGFVTPFMVGWFSGIDWDDQILKEEQRNGLENFNILARCLKRLTT